MDKIAIISDIHGNHEALRATINDIEKRKIKKIFCLGDVIGKGSKPNECLNLLKNCEMVYGNWEDFFNNAMYSDEFTKARYQLLDKQISDENKKRLKELPLCCELYISGRLIRMFHATPSNAWDNILEIDRIDKLYKQFLPTKYTGKDIADVVIYAHTHTQSLKKLYNRTLINTGSIGNAFSIISNQNKDANCENTTNADYLIIEGDLNNKQYNDIRFEFVSLRYNRKLELEESKNNPEFKNYSEELLTGTYRNIEKYKDNFKEAYYNTDDL